MPELVTLPNITLIETGTWEASTGTVTFTTQDLLAAVDALQDPAVKQPRLRFGHTDASAGMAESAGGFASQPCVGKFVNLRVEEDGTKLVGDLVGVPAWLAEILPIAYPSRSVEAYFEVNTPTGKHHNMVVASVAVLGEEFPGVATLDDLQILFSEEGPDWVQDLEFEGEMVAASMGGGNPPVTVRASVDTTDVRSAFYEQVATEDSGRYWWWIHQVYIDPSVVIADDEDGDFWLIPYSTKGNSVEFSDPVQVFIQWVETDSGKVAAQASTVKLPEQYGHADAVYASAAASRPADRQQEWTNKNNKEARATVPIDNTLLAKHLGLPEDASEEQINEALAASAEEQPAPEGSPEAVIPPEGDPVTPEVPETTPETPEAEAEAQEQIAASGKVVDIEAFRETQEYVAAQKAKERTDFVQAAVNDRKIPPARKAHYLSLMEKDEKGTREFINQLEKNAVPGGEIGTAEEEVSASARGTGLIPELEAARAAQEG